MTEAERKVMQEHAVYWKGLTDRGIAIVFGLVLDPKGLFAQVFWNFDNFIDDIYGYSSFSTKIV
jgi:hypothetical protein